MSLKSLNATQRNLIGPFGIKLPRHSMLMMQDFTCYLGLKVVLFLLRSTAIGLNLVISFKYRTLKSSI